LRRNNVSGIAHQKVLPLNDIETLLVEWCIKMAKIGQAVTKENVMDLATKLIEGTTYAKAGAIHNEKKFKANKW
jgi:hypothetical protein